LQLVGYGHANQYALTKALPVDHVTGGYNDVINDEGCDTLYIQVCISKNL